MSRLAWRATPQSAAILVALSIASAAHAAAPDDPERTARIEHLIDLLASKNAAPPIKGDARKGDDQVIRFPETYDPKLQVPVYLAIRALLDEGEDAIDRLLAHKGDRRYSFSLNSDIDTNITVSAACEKIAWRKILCFEPEIRFITKSQFDAYFNWGPGGGPLEPWWLKNKSRGLASIQAEALEASIAFMDNAKAEDAVPWHPQAEPLPPDEFNHLRDQNLRILRAIRRFVVDTKTPYRPVALDDESDSMFGLPWGGRRHNR